eukprot:3493773-Rhodomonas_salina.2
MGGRASKEVRVRVRAWGGRGRDMGDVGLLLPVGGGGEEVEREHGAVLELDDLVGDEVAHDRARPRSCAILRACSSSPRGTSSDCAQPAPHAKPTAPAAQGTRRDPAAPAPSSRPRTATRRSPAPSSLWPRP